MIRIREIDHLVLRVVDLDRMLRFYCDALGCSVERREDEIGYVLEGALEIRLADRTVVAEAGSVAHLPKNIPHAIRNPLKTPSRCLFITIPAGLDQWFDALATARNAGTLDDALYRQLSLDYGIEWLE